MIYLDLFCTQRKAHNKSLPWIWSFSKSRCFKGYKSKMGVFVWMTVKNVSCWFTVKANNDFDLKLLAVVFTQSCWSGGSSRNTDSYLRGRLMCACVQTRWSCWHLLMTFCWMVVTPQCHMKVSFCKLLSFCRQRREGNDWKRRWKIGHSCSLYFPNVPPPLQAPQPAYAIPPPQQPHLPDTHTPRHTCTQLCLLSSRPHVSCVFSRCEGKREGGSAFRWTHACQEMGVRGRWMRTGNIKCSWVLRCLQQWEAVSPRGITQLYNKDG